MLVREIQKVPAQLAALAPDQEACLPELPLVALFSVAGQSVFWMGFGFTMCVYAVLMSMAYQVIRRCAAGQVLIAPMITSLKRIGIIIAAFPLVDLALQNVSAWAYEQTGDSMSFAGSYALDFPVIGVGLLLMTMATAKRMAVQMHQDAALTI